MNDLINDNNLINNHNLIIQISQKMKIKKFNQQNRIL